MDPGTSLVRPDDGVCPGDFIRLQLGFPRESSSFETQGFALLLRMRAEMVAISRIETR